MPRYGPFLFYVKNDKPEVILYFDSDSHTYLREFGAELRPQKNVSTILQIVDKSLYLVPWSAKVAVTKMAAIMPTVTQGLDEYTKSIPMGEFLELLEQAKKAHKEILDTAGNIGTMAHRSLEDSIIFAIRNTNSVVEKLVNSPPNEKAVQCCGAALDWMRSHDVKWVCTERKVYSREYSYAGTMDGLAYVSSCADKACCPVHFVNKLSLIDWKSSNQLSETYLYQVAAYRYAYMEEHDDDITDAFILRLGKEDGKFEPWHVEEADMMDDFHTFLACMKLTWWHESTKDRISAAKKERTARKRLAKKVAEW